MLRLSPMHRSLTTMLGLLLVLLAPLLELAETFLPREMVTTSDALESKRETYSYRLSFHILSFAYYDLICPYLPFVLQISNQVLPS
jgi:hypothetical protein